MRGYIGIQEKRRKNLLGQPQYHTNLAVILPERKYYKSKLSWNWRREIISIHSGIQMITLFLMITI